MLFSSGCAKMIVKTSPFYLERMIIMTLRFRKITALLLVMLLMTSLVLPAAAAEDPGNVTILFTHDLHSHLLPSADGEDGQYGGYARLMTLIRQQKEKYPDAVLVDGGDFSMGSLFQTAYTISALELRAMGALGYDATTFGNHDYDYLPSGLAQMLNTAVASGDPLPAIVATNFLPAEEGMEGYDEDAAVLKAAQENYGVREYILLERGGVYFAIFGIFGEDAKACAPNSKQVFYDAKETARRVVDAATAECREKYGAEPVVIALSHTGTWDGKGEDYELAEAVSGIDVIVSGHTHTTFTEPVVVNDTYIVSASMYGKCLGVVHMDHSQDGKTVLTGYELIPVDETVADDPEISALVETYKREVEEKYLSDYGMGFDEILTYNPYPFESTDEVFTVQMDAALGNLISDAYMWAAEKTLGKNVDIAVTVSGIIRETVPVGDVSVSDIFNIASLGVGTEGELVEIYLTGADLKSVLEMDASVQPLLNGAQIFASGVEYSFNTSRMLFNKVDNAALVTDSGLEEIQDDELYLMVAGLYASQLLGSVEKSSFGLICITPRDAEGNPLELAEIRNQVIRDENGVALKEWYAISEYLRQMGGEMDARYAQADGRKQVYSSFNPVKLLSNANKYTYLLLAVILLLVLLVTVITRAVIRRRKRKKTASR